MILLNFPRDEHHSSFPFSVSFQPPLIFRPQIMYNFHNRCNHDIMLTCDREPHLSILEFSAEVDASDNYNGETAWELSCWQMEILCRMRS